MGIGIILSIYLLLQNHCILVLCSLWKSFPLSFPFWIYLNKNLTNYANKFHIKYSLSFNIPNLICSDLL